MPQNDTLQRIKSQSPGAQFYRADLHIHSVKGSYDVKDPSMTPAEIIATAESNGLNIIAITDHDSIDNVQTATELSHSTTVTLIPGVELSTPQGHLLVYFKDVLTLQEFYGKLTIRDRNTPNSRCEQGMTEVLNLIKPNVGFAVLAHADSEKGLDTVITGYPPHKVDILMHPSLLAVELKKSINPKEYSLLDPDTSRRSIMKQRVELLALPSDQGLARVRFSDAHARNRIGYNFQNQPMITRVKMDTPSFDGLRLAYLDADARVRLEEEIPRDIPHVLGITLAGGFLDGQTFRFSRNLNCIIGGRGAGKSTAFEAIRCISPSPSLSKAVDSEVWPDDLRIVWADEAGQEHEIIRRINEYAQHRDDPEFGPTTFPIECYGQGETAETSKRAQTDPGALLEYLNLFVDVAADASKEEETRELLLQNQTAIENASNLVAQIPQYKKLFSTVSEQLKAYAKSKGETAVKKQEALAKERAIRESISNLIDQIMKSLAFDQVDDDLKQLDAIAKPVDLVVGQNYLEKVKTNANEFKAVITTARRNTESAFATLSDSTRSTLKDWARAEEPVSQEIESIRKQLESQGVKLDVAYIKKLAEDKAKYEKKLSELELERKRLVALQQERATLLKERWSIRDHTYAIRAGFATKASDVLQGSLGDLQVSVRFRLDGHSPEGAEIIQNTMSWRTIQVPRARLLADELTIRRLLTLIDSQDIKPILGLKAADGSQVFNGGDARELLERLGEPSVRFQLERCIVHDRPLINVTKRMGTKHVTRDFSKLSLGQQQSVLLALMLTSESSYPLIIDQPEDNLDSEFIYHSLVPVLRRAKERRQVIIVTHNANIAVLGDAESIFVLKSFSDRGQIIKSGSIDSPDIRRLSCQILEGAEEAFKRRGRIYGHF